MTELSPVRVRHGLLVFGHRTQWGLIIVAAAGIFAGLYRLSVLAVIALCIWLIAKTWAAHAVKKIVVSEQFEAEAVFPGEEVQVHLTIENAKLLPVPWLELKRPFFPTVKESSGSPYRLKEKDLLCRLGWQLWHQTGTCEYFIQPQRRGCYSLHADRVTSGDPFGLFQREQLLEQNTDLIVYPPLLDPVFLELGKRDPLGSKPDYNFLYTDPLLAAGVRDYQPSDSLRTVNWKASARFQTLKSNILEGKSAAKGIIFLNTGSLPSVGWANSQKELAREVLISSAATLASQMTAKHQEWGFITDEKCAAALAKPYKLIPSPNNSRHYLQELMTFLAHLVESNQYWPLRQVLNHIIIPPGATLIVLSAACDPENALALQTMALKHSILWLFLEENSTVEGIPNRPLMPGWSQNSELAALLLGTEG